MFFQIISATFYILIILSNILSAKMIPLSFLGNLTIPAGLTIYPLTFFCIELITEFYGEKIANSVVYIALLMCLLTYGIIQFVLMLPSTQQIESVSFENVMGLSGFRIFSSLFAFFISHLIDIRLYSFIKLQSKIKFLWFRSNVSTLISQLIDTIILDLLFFCYGMGMTLKMVFPIMIFSFLYKSFFSLFNSLFIYCAIALKEFNLKNWKQGVFYE